MKASKGISSVKTILKVKDIFRVLKSLKVKNGRKGLVGHVESSRSFGCYGAFVSTGGLTAWVIRVFWVLRVIWVLKVFWILRVFWVL